MKGLELTTQERHKNKHSSKIETWSIESGMGKGQAAS
jgi:hypothetical protein